MAAWWKYHQATNGRVTQHLSPYRINAVGDLFKAPHEKIMKKVKENFWDVAPAFAAGVTLFQVAYAVDDANMRSHWS